MKKPKKNKKPPLSRRKFVGGMAAGASLLSIAPYLSLTGCGIEREGFCDMSDVDQRPEIQSSYSEGKISIDIKFPKPCFYKKSLNIEKVGRKEFELIKINKTGTINRSGHPEIPYLVQIPMTFAVFP